ncbi:MAG: hypothetical protein AAFN77_16110 [Planctomycetota bacterium]
MLYQTTDPVGERITNSASPRKAFLRIELIVTGVVMITVMSVASAICMRTNLVWKDIRYQRVAVQELSNHLDQLTRLTADEANSELESLQPSAWCERTLHEVKLTSSTQTDAIGTRLELVISWKDRFGRHDTQLSGWIVTPVDVDEEPSAEVSDEDEDGGQ